MAFLFILALPYLLLPLYEKDSGIAITSLRPNSSVHGASGLHVGQLIYQINECSVKNTSDFHSCLRQEQKSVPHYCVHLEEQLICPDCCSEANNNGSHLAFKVGAKATFCLPVREVLSRKSKNCSPTDFICDDDKEDCVAPELLHKGETFWAMKRKDHKDFLFIGSINDIYFGILSVTDYLPKYKHLPLEMPLTIQTFLYYTAS